MKENERTCAPNYEAECEQLRNTVRVLEEKYSALYDENSKLSILYQELLKEKSDLDRKIGFLEGQIEAYQYCMNCRR